ncbi:MAG TPA: tetratricopeptide repeat protein [Hyphomonas sp.]|nr:tetratricopeptide repeat protein [Hyphomonas sp.]HRX74294.1 tetratricopeptide repeat protein [Hyphomonas sp.]
MTRFALLAASLVALAVPAASAQVSVIGGGVARDCYEAALFSKVSPQEGEKICTKAIESEVMKLENRAATYTNRGVLRMRAGKYDAALADYAVAKNLKPELGAIWLNEGAAHIFRKDYATALVSLDKAIELETQDLYAAYYNRAIAKENTGDVPGAYFDFQKSLELKPDFERAEWQLSRFTVSN